MKKNYLHKFILLLILLSGISFIGHSQVLISTNPADVPDGSAMLQINSDTAGVLIPRLDKDAIPLPVPVGLIVYDNTENAFYINTNSGWVNLSTNANAWTKNGSNVYLTTTTDNVGVGTNSPGSKFVIQADAGEDEDAVLFEVKDEYGFPIFKVTSSGVRVYVKEEEEGVKAVSGGFAVGRYGAAKNIQDTTFFFVTPDSTRVYVRDNQSKAVSGGFAVGRYGAAKGVSNYIFQTNEDSTRVYSQIGAKAVSGGFAVGRYGAAKGQDSLVFFTSKDSTRVYTETSTKAVSGGFAVGRYGAAKGPTDNYLYMLPDNYFIGHQSGELLQTGNYSGKYNTFFGYQTGNRDTVAGSNVFIGYRSGYNTAGSVSGIDTLGSRNVFMGYESGLNNKIGYDNVMIGYQAGLGSTHVDGGNGYNNIFIGTKSGRSNRESHSNVVLGNNAGSILDGINNTIIGDSAGYYAYGSDNIIIGSKAGWGPNSGGNGGSNNVLLGVEAGYNQQVGTNDVFIGNQAGYMNDQGSRSVVIGNRAGYWLDINNYNVIIGDSAAYGFDDLSGTTYPFSNVIIGQQAGFMIGDNSHYNVFVGVNAGHSINDNNVGNVLVGAYAGNDLGLDNSDDHDENVMIGYQKGLRVQGNQNVMIGTGTYSSSTRNISGSVHIGNQAGDSETTDDKLYIDNWDNPNPLIYGDFASNYLRINGQLNIWGNYSFPTGSGSAGDVLVSNGAGSSASWTDPDNIDGDWTINGDEMYSGVTGNVGIGISNPVYKLDVYNSVTDDGIYSFTRKSGYARAIVGHARGGYISYGVMGIADTAIVETNDTNYGMYGSASNATYNYGVRGTVSSGLNTNYGIYGSVNVPNSTNNRGVYGVAFGSSATNYGVYGYAFNGSTNYAGYFSGNVHVNGTLSKNAGSFRIDHPLDPANKYLNHSFVESPDMMNIYNGNVKLDSNGEATVTMPDYFEALNMDFRYQLTAVGAPSPNLYIKEKIKDNQFVIAGGTPESEVSWQVTGIRNDPFAKENRIKVVEEKKPSDKGKYLNPELYKQPKDKGIHYVKENNEQ